MIYKLLRPEKSLNTRVVLPASKSISNRLLIIHSLSESRFDLKNLSDSDDTALMLHSLASGDSVKDIGHAGTSMRFLTAFYSCRPGNVIMTGSDRMKERPIGPLVDALRLLGADIEYGGKEGKPPLEIHGKLLRGGEISIKGNISSQFISALLMIAPTFENGLTLHLMGDVVSSSYINMTLDLMKQSGAEVEWSGNTIRISSGQYNPGEESGVGNESFTIESDWSAASYWYAMMLSEKCESIRLNHLDQLSLQGDSALVDIFRKLEIRTEFNGQTATLLKTGVLLKTSTSLKSADVDSGLFEYDFTNAPDLVQTMAVILCMASIPFRFSGTKTLRIKETDRISALQTELKKLGFILNSDSDGSFLAWDGEKCEPEENPVISTYHDHRMAMAFAPVALFMGEITIEDPMVVSKSYPGFWEDLKEARFFVLK